MATEHNHADEHSNGGDATLHSPYSALGDSDDGGGSSDGSSDGASRRPTNKRLAALTPTALLMPRSPYTLADDADRAWASSLRAQSQFSVWRSLQSLLPVLRWAPAYSLRRHLLGDILSGLTVGLMVIPQGLGYATVAGVPQIYGIYSAFVGSFVYVLLGGARDLSIGPTAILSLLCLNATGGDVETSIQLALLMGVLEMALAACNLGVLVELISNPVLSGFTSAAAMQIVLTQIGPLCGIKTRSQVYYALYDLGAHIRDIRTADLLVGLVSMVLLVLLSKLPKAFPQAAGPRRSAASATMQRLSQMVRVLSTGRNAVLVLVAALLSYIVARHTAGDKVPWLLVGKVPSGLPSPQVPRPSWSLVQDQVGNLLLMSLVSFLESIAIAKAFARQNGYAQHLRPNQELFAVGAANFVAAFFRSLPVTGSFSRTAVASQAGARTQLQGLFSGVVVLLALVLLTPAFFYIPKAVLAAIVIIAAGNLVDVGICGDLWRLGWLGRLDLATLLASFWACLLLDIQYGILIGVSASLAIVALQMARPKWAVQEAPNAAAAEGVEQGEQHDEERRRMIDGASSSSSSSTALLSLPSAAAAAAPRASRSPPDWLLVFRIDCALVFFNVSHVMKLLAQAELQRFEMVPQQGDDAVPRDGEGGEDEDQQQGGKRRGRGGRREVHFSEHALEVGVGAQSRGSSINGSEPSSPLAVRFSSADSSAGAGATSAAALPIAHTTLDASSSSTALLGGSPTTSSPKQHQFDPDATALDDVELERPGSLHSAITNPAPGVHGLSLAPASSPRRGARVSSPDESLQDAAEEEEEREREREQDQTVAASASASVAASSIAAPQAVVTVHADRLAPSSSGSSHGRSSFADDDFGSAAAAGSSASPLSASPSSSSSVALLSSVVAPPRLRPCRLRALLLDFSLVTLIDTTAVRGLWQLAKDLAQRQHRVTLHFANVRPEIRGIIEESLSGGVAFPHGVGSRMHPSVDAGVEALTRLAAAGASPRAAAAIAAAAASSPSPVVAASPVSPPPNSTVRARVGRGRDDD